MVGRSDVIGVMIDECHAVMVAFSAAFERSIWQLALVVGTMYWSRTRLVPLALDLES